jgi:hypothetical protein
MEVTLKIYAPSFGSVNRQGEEFTNAMNDERVRASRGGEARTRSE